MKTGLALALGGLLAACTGTSGAIADAAPPLSAARSIPTGPAADYPMVLGDPFVVDGVTYTPTDALNVDEVGFAAADDAATTGVTAAHRTLPLPSYIEVTALDSGRTALVRVERRGPMTNAHLIALSPDALVQLGITDGAPVRVRRVNPPEDDRAELRQDQAAPLRMDTPVGLLAVLKRRLPPEGAASLSDPRQTVVSGRIPDESVLVALEPVPIPLEVTPPAPITTEPVPVEPAATGNLTIQVGAFAVRENAERLAAKIGGTTIVSGRLTLVRAGPFANRGQAEQALAKLREQGYSDARIVTLN